MTEQIVVTTNVAANAVIPARNIPAVPLSLVDLGKRLLDASKRGDTMEIRTLMSSGAPFTTDWLGTSPLHFASMHGHIETVTILMRAGISRDARTKVDRTPLHVASQNGHFEVVQILLKNNAIVDACDMLKMTPLHWAVENGHTNVVNLLLKHDASTHHIDKFDRTPMDIALGRMQMDIVQLLQSALNMQSRPVTNHEAMIEEEVLTTETPEQVLSTEDPTRSVDLKTDVSNEAGDNVVGGNNTSVLTALAALAEATAPSSASSDTTNWLSNRTTLSLSNSDPETPLTLTEAGKLALTNFMKDQGVASDGSTVMTLVDQDGNQVLLVQQSDADTGEVTTNEESIPTELHIDTNKVEEELIEQTVE